VYDLQNAIGEDFTYQNPDTYVNNLQTSSTTSTDCTVQTAQQGTTTCQSGYVPVTNFNECGQAYTEC